MLWGEYGLTKEKVQLVVHLELLRGSKIFPVNQEKETIIAPAAGMEEFKIQSYLGREKSYVVLLILGLAAVGRWTIS